MRSDEDHEQSSNSSGVDSRGSNATNEDDEEGVIDLVFEEKGAAINREGEKLHSSVSLELIYGTRASVPPPPQDTRQQTSISIESSLAAVPGAFRISTSMQDPDTGMDVHNSSTQSVVSEYRSESGVIVIPKASLVKEEGQYSMKASPDEHPMVIAEKSDENHHKSTSAVAKSRRRSKMHRYAVLVALLLIAVLLAGVLSFLLLGREDPPAPKRPIQQRSPLNDGNGRINGDGKLRGRLLL